MASEKDEALLSLRRMNIDEYILQMDDPIDGLASTANDVLFDPSTRLTAAIHYLVCRDMGIPTATIVGAANEEESEGEPFLAESDPRYDLYWATLSEVWSALHAQCIVRNRNWLYDRKKHGEELAANERRAQGDEG